MSTYICMGLPDMPEAVGTIDNFIDYFSRQDVEMYKPPRFEAINDKQCVKLYLYDGDLYWDVVLCETINIKDVGNA